MSTYQPRSEFRSGRWTSRAQRPSQSVPTLEQRYDWYRERQTSELLSLIPKDAIRHLYRHAREWAARKGEHETKDPMATLRRFCAEILPLPPFEVWVVNFQSHRGAYVFNDMEPPTEHRAEPVTVEARSIMYRRNPWRVELRLFSDEDVWRGYMVFQSETGTSFGTADVFCEAMPGVIRDRFLAFESDTLKAFLRSSLP